MQATNLIVIAALGAASLCAEEFVLKANAGGSIKVMTSLTIEDSGRPHLTGQATNQTDLAIQNLRLCVKSLSIKKVCLFTIWTTKAVDAGGSFSFDVISPKRIKLADLSHTLIIDSIEQFVPPAPRAPSRFDLIKRVYVDMLDGNTGAALRDNLIGVLANSGRFVAVEKIELADAVIRGRSDSTEVATKTASIGKGSAGQVFGTVFAGSSSNTISQSIVDKSISLRLTLLSGEVMWAWDETKPCNSDLVRAEVATITKAKCAVQDLAATAAR